MDELSYVPNSDSHTINPPVTECDAAQLNAHSSTNLPDACNSKSGTYEWATRILDPLLVLPVEDEDAQGILDEHCSRIWADEQDYALMPEASGEFAKQVGDLDYVVRESHGPGADPTLRQSRGAFSGNPRDRASGRRRTALSAALTSSYHAEPDASDPVQRGSRRRSAVRVHNRSDARSTASWDSGVVTHCPYPVDPSFPNNTLIQGELETRSIVAAASLQALSSSTTELAMVNSEVTTKLVEHMTRHYRRNADPGLVVPPTSSHPFAPKMSPYQNYDLLCSPPLMCRSAYHHHYPRPIPGVDPITEKATFLGASAIQGVDAVGYCVSCVQNAWRPCNAHRQVQTQSFGPVWSIAETDKVLNKAVPTADTGIAGRASTQSHSFPAASDTSSTFDSGISSTYDQLPLTTDRGSRSQSLRNWHASFRDHSSGPHFASRPLRAPSAPRSQFSNAQHCCPSGVCTHLYTHSNPAGTGCTQSRNNYYLSATADESGSKQCHTLTNYTCSNSCSVMDCCDCKRNLAYDLSHPSDVKGQEVIQAANNPPTGHPAGSGQLLQHWLYLQTSQSVCSDEGPTSAPTKTSQSRKQHSHHHGHHNQHNSHRRSSTHRRYSSKHVGISPTGRDATNSTSKNPGSRQSEPLPCSRTNCALDSVDSTPGTQGSVGLIVGYYLCDDPVPYRTVWPGTQSTGEVDTQSGSTVLTHGSLTLGQFKQLIAKKGSYRYFFKKPSDEFGTGVVHEELTHDDAIIPLWDGKVVARIERAE
ncbi:unnamed protein product [Echinostoma caproni]|uniref:DIX domain-containing protein n=1 Tax=Echinostoma caproni TaxID=27848 RepID=A0A183A936_9TREM|nr:unnamed protein product [Echinostoma caproni]